MLEVLGCYSADYAAQLSVNSNFIANELSLFSQKDRKTICFFIIMCCFSLAEFQLQTTKTSSIALQFNLASSRHKSWIMLALCPVNGSSTPRCVYTSQVNSAEFCDSSVVLRGVSLRGLSTVKSFSWESCVGAKSSFPYTNSVSAFDSLFFFTSQLPAHPPSGGPVVCATSLLISCLSQEVLRSVVLFWTFYFLSALSHKGVLI